MYVFFTLAMCVCLVFRRVDKTWKSDYLFRDVSLSVRPSFLLSAWNNSPPTRVGCLKQPTLPLSIRINTGSLYRNVSILNYKRDKDNVS